MLWPKPWDGRRIFDPRPVSPDFVHLSRAALSMLFRGLLTALLLLLLTTPSLPAPLDHPEPQKDDVPPSPPESPVRHSYPTSSFLEMVGTTTPQRLCEVPGPLECLLFAESSGS